MPLRKRIAAVVSALAIIATALLIIGAVFEARRRFRLKSTRLFMAASLAAACVITMLAAQSAQAQKYTEKVLHAFAGTDGANPFAGVIRDTQGNLYGTTDDGGGSGYGVVFKLTLGKSGKWTETVLNSFTGGTDGGDPLAGLIMDTKGNLYGSTYSGGDLSDCNGFGCGVVFQLTPGKGGKWTETVLYSFTGGTDGTNPEAGVIMDTEGNLYGTTYYGGGGGGVVFKLTPGKGGRWTETVLYSFTGGTDGANPEAGVIQDTQGNLYGTTDQGGDFGYGVVFKLTLSKSGKWTETVLYTFTRETDGWNPLAGVIQDVQGNLYGATSAGGKEERLCNMLGGGGCGVVFKLSTTRKEGVLYSFTGAADGFFPAAGVIMDTKENLYGTTYYGGDLSGCGGGGCGVVFKLTPDKSGKWTETVLYTFTGAGEGANPFAGVIQDAQGNLYGTTAFGGDTNQNCRSSCGVVFKLTP